MEAVPKKQNHRRIGNDCWRFEIFLHHRFGASVSVIVIGCRAGLAYLNRLARCRQRKTVFPFAAHTCASIATNYTSDINIHPRSRPQDEVHVRLPSVLYAHDPEIQLPFSPPPCQGACLEPRSKSRFRQLRMLGHD